MDVQCQDPAEASIEMIQKTSVEIFKEFQPVDWLKKGKAGIGRTLASEIHVAACP